MELQRYRPRPVVYDADVDGPVRYCPGCDEWWPDDDEFWIKSEIPAGAVATSRGQQYVRRTTTPMIMCRACHYERKRRWNEQNDQDPERRERRLRQMREAARRYRASRRAS